MWSNGACLAKNANWAACIALKASPFSYRAFVNYRGIVKKHARCHPLTVTTVSGCMIRRFFHVDKLCGGFYRTCNRFNYGGIMFSKSRLWLFAALLFVGLPVACVSGNVYAAGHSKSSSSNSSSKVRGTWHSAKETLTFRRDGTVIYKGKRYYYAVSSGGTIQLTGKHGTLTIPYYFTDGKLTLTIDGKRTVYTRRR